MRCLELLEKVCVDNGVCPDKEEKETIDGMFKFFEMMEEISDDHYSEKEMLNSVFKKIRVVDEKGYFKD